MPSLIHHTDSAVRPVVPVEANGEPLSERITSGKPYSRNARSSGGLHSAYCVLRQHRRDATFHHAVLELDPKAAMASRTRQVSWSVVVHRPAIGC
jgi:hypothetical protein